MVLVLVFRDMTHLAKVSHLYDLTSFYSLDSVKVCCSITVFALSSLTLILPWGSGEVHSSGSFCSVRMQLSLQTRTTEIQIHKFSEKLLSGLKITIPHTEIVSVGPIQERESTVSLSFKCLWVLALLRTCLQCTVHKWSLYDSTSEAVINEKVKMDLVRIFILTF